MKWTWETALGNSQDAPGLKEGIILALSRHGLDSALKKRVFLLSNGASVNSKSNFGLIRLFQGLCMASIYVVF